LKKRVGRIFTWKDKYNKIIHVIRDEDSPLIFFNRGHKTFSYFSDKDTDKQLWKNNQITLSHILRQKVIAEKNAACFSVKDKIRINRDKPTKLEIVYKKVEIDKRISIDGNEFIPDLTIEFDEPADLALKWKNKILVEVVEKHETNGEKIEAYEKLGHGVIEIPYTKAFDDLSKKSRSEIKKEDIDQLIWKIKNYFKKEIWSDLIVDPSSMEYLMFKAESSVLKINKQLTKTVNDLQCRNEEYKKRYNELTVIAQAKDLQIKNINKTLSQKNSEIDNKSERIFDLENLIIEWNRKPLFFKLLKWFRLQHEKTHNK